MHLTLGGNLLSTPRPGQISDYKEQVVNDKKVGLTEEVGAFLHLTMGKSKPRLVGIGWVLVMVFLFVFFFNQIADQLWLFEFSKGFVRLN